MDIKERLNEINRNVKFKSYAKEVILNTNDFKWMSEQLIKAQKLLDAENNKSYAKGSNYWN